MGRPKSGVAGPSSGKDREAIPPPSNNTNPTTGGKDTNVTADIRLKDMLTELHQLINQVQVC